MFCRVQEEEEDSPAEMAGPLCPSCVPVSCFFLSSERVPSFSLLAVVSSWPVGL